MHDPEGLQGAGGRRDADDGSVRQAKRRQCAGRLRRKEMAASHTGPADTPPQTQPYPLTPTRAPVLAPRTLREGISKGVGGEKIAGPVRVGGMPCAAAAAKGEEGQASSKPRAGGTSTITSTSHTPCLLSTCCEHCGWWLG